MQEYNCLKTAMVISKVPGCLSRIETSNKVYLKTYHQSCSLPLNNMFY